MKKKDIIVFFVIFSVVIVFLFIMYTFFSMPSNIDPLSIGGGSKVGLLELKGVIYDSRSFVDDIERFLDNSSVKALVIRINSPGGGVAASQEIYEAIKRATEDVPVVVSMAGVAASGGYYSAIAADSIFANPGTTTGSIGVIASISQFYRLLDKIGIDNEVIKSGKFKDTGSSARKMTSDERAYLQGWIDDAYEQFVEAVAEERNLPLEEVKKVADGRVFTGRQALELGLIDRIGDLHDAIMTAGEMAGIKGVPVVLEKKKKKLTLLDILLGDVEETAKQLLNENVELQYLMP